MEQTPQSKRVIHFELEPVEGYEREVGIAIWALQDCRARTLDTLQGLPDSALEAPPPAGKNTIGAMLYHIADSEASWIYESYLQQPYPHSVVALFPVKEQDEHGNLQHPQGETLDDHLNRLSQLREMTLDVFRGTTMEQFQAMRPKEWPSIIIESAGGSILNHLGQHEAEHRGEIAMIIESIREQEQREGVVRQA